MDQDHALVEAARTGDTDAVETLVRRYQSRMFNFARTLTAGDADAEDLAQETFVRAFRGLSRFRGESSFKNWLYRIATNVARTHLGKRTRQSPVWDRRVEADDVPEHQLASRTESAEETVIRRDAIDRALSTLSRDLQIATVWRRIWKPAPTVGWHSKNSRPSGTRSRPASMLPFRPDSRRGWCLSSTLVCPGSTCCVGEHGPIAWHP